MNRVRRAWPVAKLILTFSVGIGVALLVLSWALLAFGWVDADGFVAGVRDGFTIFASGAATAFAWLLLAAIFGHGER